MIVDVSHLLIINCQGDPHPRGGESAVQFHPWPAFESQDGTNRLLGGQTRSRLWWKFSLCLSAPLSSESAWPTPYYACFSGYLIQIRYLYGSLSRGQGKRTNHKVVTIWVEQWNTFVATINVTTFKFCNNLRKVVIFTTFKRCNIFTISNEIKCALSVKKSYFNEKNDQNFHICLRLGPRGLTAKYPVFFDELPFRKPVKHYLADFFLLRGEGWYPLIPLRRILLKSRYFRSKNSLFAFFIYS